MTKHPIDIIVRTSILLFSVILLLASCKSGASNRRTAAADAVQPGPVMAQNALHEAALNGQAEAVDALLEQGADVNALDQEGRSALMYAAFNGHEAIAKNLMERGAEVNVKDGMGRTALMFASTGPFPGTVSMLLEANAAIDAADAEEHFTALMYAAAEGQLEVVSILLEHGADAALKDVDGDMAVTFARNNGHTEVADLLSAISK